jgi:hypothetical protein
MPAHRGKHRDRDTQNAHSSGCVGRLHQICFEVAHGQAGSTIILDQQSIAHPSNVGKDAFGKVAVTVSTEDVDRVRAVGNFQQSQSVSEAGESIGESSVCDGNTPESVRASDLIP